MGSHIRSAIRSFARSRLPSRVRSLFRQRHVPHFVFAFGIMCTVVEGRAHANEAEEKPPADAPMTSRPENKSPVLPSGSFFYVQPGESHDPEQGFVTPPCRKLDVKAKKELPTDLECDAKRGKLPSGLMALRCHAKKADTYFYFFKTSKQCNTDRNASLEGGE